MKIKTPTVADYLADLPKDKRLALEKLRRTIRAVIPRAQEVISYQLPAFRLDERIVLWYGAAANHCSLYPGAVVSMFKDELEDYETSKGTIRFQPDHPLPAPLIRKIVRASVAKNMEKDEKQAKKTRKKSMRSR